MNMTQGKGAGQGASSRSRRFPRPNAIIGRVVPLLLLLYVIYTYRLVIVVFLCTCCQATHGAAVYFTICRD
jgi:hypothetical protein